jgi:hypothetical protein
MSFRVLVALEVEVGGRRQVWLCDAKDGKGLDWIRSHTTEMIKGHERRFRGRKI